MLKPSQLTIRRLEAPDVHAVLTVISDCRREYGLASRVAAVLEPADNDLLESYRHRHSAYFVALVGGEVAGGAGIARLHGGDGSICELQRMYLRPASRGLGIGGALLTQCLQAARQFGYQRCYAETISEMTTALALYERHGFQRLQTPLGRPGTGTTTAGCYCNCSGSRESYEALVKPGDSHDRGRSSRGRRAALPQRFR